MPEIDPPRAHPLQASGVIWHPPWGYLVVLVRDGLVYVIDEDLDPAPAMAAASEAGENMGDLTDELGLCRIWWSPEDIDEFTEC